MPSTNEQDERTPLLNGHYEHIVTFEKDDPQDPQNWTPTWKYLQTLQIFIVALILPMASSMNAPAASEMAQDFGVSKGMITAGQTVFVIMLGIGPLLWAPMSETFGRRPIFVLNLVVFALLQIPTALAPNVETFLVVRLLSGFTGSVGVANGGGSISDMFEKHQRAKVLGVYLTGPLLGPTLGGLIGGITVGKMHWWWIFGVLGVLAAVITVVTFFFLYETRAITILQQRKRELEKESPGKIYVVQGVGDQGVFSKTASNSTRAVKILTTQPIVFTMSLYQALVFSSMYTLYSQYTSIWSAPPYEFNKTQIGLAYLGPAVGFIVTAIFVVLFIDKVYSSLAERHKDDGVPEYRLPLANIGAVLLPISLFWFGWTIEKGLSWPIPLASTLLFGASQVSIFNCVQTYYIDAYESNAASALAAGAFLRSVVGGIVPLFVSSMFEKLGYGWGMSVFGILSVVLMPAPAVFYSVGRRLREKFPFKG